ncbi:VQ motif-containing protein 25-like [Prosopis cineraria]|uniref:VQ motif-containing protein 25-like n=1 Tax=Prosopis cineraria TaxID=364024 RepID=UPI00240EA8C9|nr:VQ motif-containing protein 25-like [Prosopis cineraria]
MTKPHALFPSSSSSSSNLGIDQRVGSNMIISKLKPKIRVIHVDAPRIIQTDAANFRDLVQRLTGKPEDDDDDDRRRRRIPPNTKDLTENEEEEDDFLGLRNMKRIKHEGEEEDHDEISRTRSKSKSRLSGFFDHGFSELDGFIEQLSTMD